MLNKNEFRIGNIVKNHEGYIKIIGIPAEGDVQVVPYPHLHEERNFDGVIQGIDLTTDVLLKCAFVERGSGFYAYIEIAGDRHNMEERMRFQVQIHDERYYTPLLSNGIVYLTSFHHLQNLFFSVVGKELVFRP